MSKRALASVLVLVPVLLAGACRQPPSPSSSSDNKSASKGPSKADLQAEVHALEAEVVALRSRLSPDVPVRNLLPAVNTHEHLLFERHLAGYLPAARALNVRKTVIVASPRFTLFGKGEQGEPSMSKNFETVLNAAKMYPGEIVPFFTISPDDKDALARAKKHVEAGGKGVKLYSGHSNLHNKPLTDATMMPVYAYFEELGLPINWHINLTKWHGEFEQVMDKHPKLNVMVPHFGVCFWNPEKYMPVLAKLMRKYPNMYVDTSLGTREILIDGVYRVAEHKELFRAFFDEFQDRIVYGSDSVITGNSEKTTSWYFKVIQATRDHLELDRFQFDLAEGYSRYRKKGRDPTGEIVGMGLPKPILQKIYWDNAEAWLAGPSQKWSTPQPMPTGPLPKLELAATPGATNE